VDSSNLRPWQALKIRKSLEKALGYLARLQRRMELMGFPPNDPLFVMTVRTRHDMQMLLMELHYLSCESGVGRKRSE
jgi:hypothetical protein